MHRVAFILSASLTAIMLFTATTFASEMTPTIYDDGRSCPANCDAHVVFAPVHNGTGNAFLPASPAGTHQKCVNGQACRICFTAGDPQSCMDVMYGGNGPHKGRFDLTPAVYDATCGQAGIPDALASQCKAMARQARGLAGGVNCIRQPADPKCVSIIATAEQRKQEDAPLYEQCLREGEGKFNRSRPAAEQRSNACAYTMRQEKCNSKGQCWRMLLPAACRDGTYVGPFGTDCCTGNLLADASFGPECKPYYPK